MNCKHDLCHAPVLQDIFEDRGAVASEEVAPPYGGYGAVRSTYAGTTSSPLALSGNVPIYRPSLQASRPSGKNDVVKNGI